MTPRQREVKRVDYYTLLWIVLLTMSIIVRSCGVVTNPWPVVLLPLWGPPVVLIGYGLLRRVLL
jgi:hypothetical protein